VIGNIPVSTVFIAAGLVLFSAIVANRAKDMILFGRRTSWMMALGGVFICAVGVFLQFEIPVTARPMQLAATNTVLKNNEDFQVSFEPKTAYWGQAVRIRVWPPADRIDVYLNDNPLPSVPKGDGIFMVTIPTVSKSGFFTVSVKGNKIRAKEELKISAK
jgi:hypothetical protein